MVWPEPSRVAMLSVVWPPQKPQLVNFTGPEFVALIVTDGAPMNCPFTKEIPA